MSKKWFIVLMLIVLFIVFSNVDYSYGSIRGARLLAGLDFLLATADYVFSNIYIGIGLIVFVVLFVRDK